MVMVILGLQHMRTWGGQGMVMVMVMVIYSALVRSHEGSAGGNKGGTQGKRASKREKGVKGKGTFQICTGESRIN